MTIFFRLFMREHLYYWPLFFIPSFPHLVLWQMCQLHLKFRITVISWPKIKWKSTALKITPAYEPSCQSLFWLVGQSVIITSEGREATLPCSCSCLVIILKPSNKRDHFKKKHIEGFFCLFLSNIFVIKVKFIIKATKKKLPVTFVKFFSWFLPMFRLGARWSQNCSRCLAGLPGCFRKGRIVC